MSVPRRFDYDEAKRLRADGLTYTQIAERFGVSDSAIYLAVNESARKRSIEAAKRWQKGGVCEDCGGPCIRATHKSRILHGAPDGLVLCTTCRGRRKRTGVRVENGIILVRCGSCRAEKPLGEYGPRVANQLVAGESPRKRTCRSCEARKRQAYRERHKVPCRECGDPCLPASEKGARGRDTELCRSCWSSSDKNPINRRRVAA